MNNLLIVAYYFPPSGGPGVQRVLKHVKYLSEFGWNPVVLTVSNGQFPARDESLLKEIPPGIEVIRTKIFEPYDIYRALTGKKPGSAIDVNVIKKDDQKIGGKEKLAELIRATFFIPDARIGWLATARKAVDSIVAKMDINAVYSSSPPYTCSLIARYAKRKYKLPWIAGFRDPWTGFISSPKRWALPAAIDRAMERSVFNEADAVECAWTGIIKDALRKFPFLSPKKFHHIPNGYDSNDFPVVEIKTNDVFTMSYSGSMYGRRNPQSLFAALERLIEQKRIRPEEFSLRFIGRFGAEVEKMFADASFKSSIQVINYLPHSESIKMLMQSDALLLIVDESKESVEIVPGKVYEYIGVKKPILAIAPRNGAIAELIAETRAGLIAHQSEISDIAENILGLFQNWKRERGTGQTAFNPNTEIIANYERRNAAKALAELLAGLL